MAGDDPLAGGATIVARLTTDAATARHLLDALEQVVDEETVVTTQAIDSRDPEGSWSLAIHFAQAPDEVGFHRLVAHLAGAAAANALVFETIAPRDWVRMSLEGLAPVAAGRFVVHGAHDRASVGANRVGIEVEAALAFGTGHHGTTRGCLLAFDALLKRRPGVLGRGRRARILDVGTGTGVLASDIAGQAVIVARENARLNRVAPLITVLHASGLTDRRFRARAPFDIIFANILLPPLKRLARPIGRLCTPDGRVILSGLLPAHMNAALAAYRAAGFILDQRLLVDGWTTLVLAGGGRHAHHASRRIARRHARF